MGSEDVHGHRAPSLLPPAIRTPLRQPPGTAIYVNLTRVQLIRSGDSPPRGFHVRVHLSPFHVLPPPMSLPNDGIFRRRSADVGGLQLAMRGQSQGQGWLDGTAWHTTFAFVAFILLPTTF